MADQQQLYSSISEMKIATPVKVEVFTERRTREKKEIKRDLLRGRVMQPVRSRVPMEQGC